MTVVQKIAAIRSFGYWVRECDEGSPVKYIIVDPCGDEDCWMVAGDEDVLDLTLEDLSSGGEEQEAHIASFATPSLGA